MPTEGIREQIPITNVLSELNTNWETDNVAKPSIIEMAGSATTDATRIDLNKGDYLIGRPGSPSLEETPIGNWKYVNRMYNIEVELQTKDSRQRLYNLMREVRKLCHSRRHSMDNFQRLQFLNFTEAVGEQLRIWTGTIQLQVVNNGVLAEIT